MNKLNEFFLQNQSNLKVILINVFNTIILRDVHPEYVKKIWAKKIGLIFNLSISYEEIYKIRNELESTIRNINKQNGFDHEFKYETLINKFYNRLANIEKDKITNMPIVEFYDICIEIELDIEKSVQRIDPDGISFLKLVKEKNVFTACVLDFYMPKHALIELLDYHGILSFFDEIFVSSDYLSTKRAGKLYDLLINKLNIDENNIMMIGDNRYCDYEVPKAKGLKVYHIDREYQVQYYSQFMKEISNKKTINNKLIELKDECNKKYNNFEIIAFALFEFIEKLYEILIRDNKKDVFFLSREGEYLKKIFDLYQDYQGINKRGRIKTHYLLVSRKATFLPSLKKLEDEEFEILFRQYRKISLSEFLLSLNFTQKDIHRIADLLKIDLNKKEEDFPTSKVFEELLNNSSFKLIYETSRAEQYNNFIKYIESFGVNIRKEGLNIVDVGWKGTIQDNIFKIFDEKIYINGYYLGLIAEGISDQNNNKRGVVFSTEPVKSKYFEIYSKNITVFEIMLGASHGSAERYLQQTGVPIVQTHQENEEQKLFTEVIAPIQNRITEIFQKICKIMCKTNFNIKDYERTFAKIHSRIILFPTKQEMNFFNKLYHFENFGIFRLAKFHNKESTSIKKILQDTFELLTEPKKFLGTIYWMPINLYNKRLGWLRYLFGSYYYIKSFILSLR